MLGHQSTGGSEVLTRWWHHTQQFDAQGGEEIKIFTLDSVPCWRLGVNTLVATQAKGQDVLPAGFDVIFNLSQEGYGVFVLVLCLNKLCNRLDILLAASDTWIHPSQPASQPVFWKLV